MRLNILIGGKAGQGLNKISKLVSEILAGQGYYIFNYRDYPSVIRGGHNFNIISISDEKVGSYESKIDGVIALDKETLKLHKNKLKKNSFIIDFKQFEKANLGINLNVALAGALIKVLGVEKELLIQEIKTIFKNKEAIYAAEIGFESQKKKLNLRKLNNKVTIMSGSDAVAKSAVQSGLDIYFAYPMTPATGVLHILAKKQAKIQDKNENIKSKNFMIFQPENEIAVINMALGASFSGARVMIGTSGGGFDLMSEALSFQGQTEIPLVIYLASRPGPGTGMPTYTAQSDLNTALRAGHGEFPRILVAPGDSLEAIEKTNEAFYLSQKFNCLSIILSDKHLAESEFSIDEEKINKQKILKITTNRKIPLINLNSEVVKSNSYEHDLFGNTTESAELAVKNAEKRLVKYNSIKKACEKFKMTKVYGNKQSKNLIISWGSTKGVILDAIKNENIDCKFLQVLYLMPMSNQIKKEIEKSKKVILIENNLTGQLGRLIREKTGFKIQEKNRILKYDGRPFASDELSKLIKEKLRN